MLFLVVVAVGLLTVGVAGGRFSVLAELTIRGQWLLAGALLVQVVVITVLRRPPHAIAAGLHLLSYALAAAFLLANRRLRGLSIVAAGGLLNVVAIAANGGTMPATRGALRVAGIAADADHFANSGQVVGARLGLLGDVFAVPHQLGIANVFSAGDVIICVGVIGLVHAAAGCPWAMPARRRPLPFSARPLPESCSGVRRRTSGADRPGPPS